MPRAAGESSSPTPHRTTPLDAANCYWFITEKGLRAGGAESMRSTAASLRATAAQLVKAARRLAQEVPAVPNGSEEAPLLDSRRGTVCYRYRNERRVPDLRLGGQWLERAGFDLGRKYQVEVREGKLTIWAEPALEARA